MSQSISNGGVAGRADWDSPAHSRPASEGGLQNPAELPSEQDEPTEPMTPASLTAGCHVGPNPVDAWPACPRPWRKPGGFLYWAGRTLFALLTLWGVLAITASIPLVNFLAFGYLLEAEGRVARTGRFRDAFPSLSVMPRIGIAAVGITLWLAPLLLLASNASDARLIATGSATDQNLHTLLVVLAVVIGLNLVFALSRGVTIGCFFLPIQNVRWCLAHFRRGAWLTHWADNSRQFWQSLPLKRYFWLGARGLVGALAWLLIPTALFAAASEPTGGAFLVTVLGGVLLLPVLAWVPFLQARFACENRLSGMFAWREIRREFRSAPLCWLLALVMTYVLALPLYLFKVVLLPEDAMWGVTPVFLASIFPSKILTGWAYHQATVRDRPAWWGFRWLSRGLIIPLLAAFIFVLFFTQFIGEHGKGVLFEHHALLLPVPF